MEKYCAAHGEWYQESLGCLQCAAGISHEAVLKQRGVMPVISIRPAQSQKEK